MGFYTGADQPTMTVYHNPDRAGSILHKRWQPAIQKKQTFYTYPLLAIIVLVYHVWGMATVTPLVYSPSTLITTPTMVQLLPNESQVHGQLAAEVMFQAAKNLLLQTASYSTLLPREVTSALQAPGAPSAPGNLQLTVWSWRRC